MDKTKFLQYAKRKSWKVQDSDEPSKVVISPCPLCDGPGPLVVDFHSSTYRCNGCGDGEEGDRSSIARLFHIMGDLSALLSDGGQQTKTSRPSGQMLATYQQALLIGERFEDVRVFLAGHGIEQDDWSRFGLGAMEKGGKLSVAIPVNRGQELINICFLLIEDLAKRGAAVKGDYLYVPGGGSLEKVILVPTELDAIALHIQRVGVGVALSNSTPKAKAMELLAVCKDIAILGFQYDRARELAERLGAHRCRIVDSETSPLMTMAAGVPGSGIIDAVRAARGLLDHRIASPEEYLPRMLERLKRPEGRRGVSTGWANLDLVFGGWRRHEFTIVTGGTGGGKTTWMKSVPLNLARAGFPVVIGSFENGPESIMDKMVMEVTERNLDEWTEEDIRNGVAQIERLPLKFFDVHGRIEWDVLKDLIYLAINRFGPYMIVLDNLGWFVKTARPEHERHEIERVCQDLKEITQMTGVHIVLIHHPHALKESNPIVSMNDLKGSSDIEKLIDNGITIWRPRVTDTKASTRSMGMPAGVPKTVVLGVVWKVRSDAGQEGRIFWDFDTRTTTYRVLTEDEMKAASIEAARAKRKKKKGDGTDQLPLSSGGKGSELPTEKDHFAGLE